MLFPINKVLRKILLPVFLLSANGLFSQIQQDTLIQIISYGLDVYAKDTFSFKPDERSTLQAISENIGDPRKMNEAIGLLKTNSSSQLKKVAGNVEKWLAKGNATNAYQPVVKLIEETLTNGGDGPAAKDWRKKNVAALFTQPVNNYLKSAAEETDGEETTGQVPDTTLEANSTALSKTTGENNMLSTIALIFALLSFTGVAYLFFLLTNKLKDYDGSRKRQRADLDQLKADLAQLKTSSPAAAAVKPTAPVAEERLKQLEAKIAQLEKGMKPTVTVVPPKKTAPQPEAAAPPVKSPAEPTIVKETLFAKLPDLDNGFSQGALTTSQNGEKIYQIETNGDSATFMITNDAGAQKYALSDFRYYLEKACNYINEPKPGCRIDTKSYGELAKDGNSWIIRTKAQIEFV